MARQSQWTREQTIVALRAYFSIPFNKANNSNKEIISLSKIIGRSTNSLKMKIGNFGSLDPELAKLGIVGLTGASKLDRDIWDEFANDKEKLAYESTVLISQFENRKIEDLFCFDEDNVIEGRERLSLVKTRINQNFFRDCILSIYDNKCCITGLGIPKLLIASHIVPWSKDEKNRLNPANGLCLNSFHDKAFDEGYITITPDYRVKLSRVFLDHDNDVAITKFFGEYHNVRITMPERYYPSTEFLLYHNEKIFIR